MSASYRVNFQISCTEDLRQGFQLTDKSGAPVDLTGAALRMGIEVASAPTAFEVSTGNGRIVLDAASSGRFSIAIPAADIATLGQGVHAHDLLVTFATGHVHRVWQGALTLDRGIARAMP